MLLIHTRYYRTTHLYPLSMVVVVMRERELKVQRWMLTHTHVFDTGWQRPIGCLTLQVIFRKRATNYRLLLQKITYKDKASYGSSPLCIIQTCCSLTHTISSTHSLSGVVVVMRETDAKVQMRMLTYTHVLDIKHSCCSFTHAITQL